jgi:hypothetical protein
MTLVQTKNYYLQFALNMKHHCFYQSQHQASGRFKKKITSSFHYVILWKTLCNLESKLYHVTNIIKK